VVFWGGIISITLAKFWLQNIFFPRHTFSMSCAKRYFSLEILQVHHESTHPKTPILAYSNFSIFNSSFQLRKALFIKPKMI
jgi:hypothetical protein